MASKAHEAHQGANWNAHSYESKAADGNANRPEPSFSMAKACLPSCWHFQSQMHRMHSAQVALVCYGLTVRISSPRMSNTASMKQMELELPGKGADNRTSQFLGVLAMVASSFAYALYSIGYEYAGKAGPNPPSNSQILLHVGLVGEQCLQTRLLLQVLISSPCENCSIMCGLLRDNGALDCTCPFPEQSWRPSSRTPNLLVPVED